MQRARSGPRRAGEQAAGDGGSGERRRRRMTSEHVSDGPDRGAWHCPVSAAAQGAGEAAGGGEAVRLQTPETSQARP